MNSNINVGWCALVLLVLLLRLPVGRTLKSNDMSTFKLPQQAASRDVMSHLQGSGSPTANCPVLPPCRCRPALEGSPSRTRVMCDSAQTSRRRVLRFSKSSVVARSFDRLSLSYAGLNALPAAAFRHIRVGLTQLFGFLIAGFFLSLALIIIIIIIIFIRHKDRK